MVDPATLRDKAAQLGKALEAVRAMRPRVHCITSTVAAERTANSLLALGATPSMTTNLDEIGDFVRGSDALLINLGMFDPANRPAALLAVDTARQAGKPWVLDPVFVDRSARRLTLAMELLAAGPTVLKANAAESFLRDKAPSGTVTVLTGATDSIYADGKVLHVTNGDAYGARVTAVGCALGAVIAAFQAATGDAAIATAAAVATYAVAAEQAAATAAGPGTFGTALYDTLAALDGATLTQAARLS